MALQVIRHLIYFHSSLPSPDSGGRNLEGGSQHSVNSMMELRDWMREGTGAERGEEVSSGHSTEETNVLPMAAAPQVPWSLVREVGVLG